MTSSAPKSLASSTYSADVTQEDLDSAADEVTIGLDDAERARIEQSVAVVNAVYGAPARLAILALRPNWHSDDLGKGRVKVVYSGTPSDTPPVVHHVRRDSQTPQSRNGSGTSTTSLRS